MLFTAILLAVPLTHAASPSEETPKPHKPCTIVSPKGSFFDLNPLAISSNEEGWTKKKLTDEDHVLANHNGSWHVNGHDIGYNFTMNFCRPVIENLTDVEGISESVVANVSAFYTDGGKTFSIGQLNQEPFFRGRKLILNYTMGSPCESECEPSDNAPSAPSAPSPSPSNHDDWDDITRRQLNSTTRARRPSSTLNPSSSNSKSNPNSINTLQSAKRRKSTIVALLCERDPFAPVVEVSFVGASPDECTYFFEARSSAACSIVAAEEQPVGPAGVFGIIVLIAALAYLIGGVAYQRTVMHQRGWRQLPNYALWSGAAGWVSDYIYVLCGSCGGFLRRKKGYNQLPTRNDERRRENEANRLIDQIDEEWD